MDIVEENLLDDAEGHFGQAFYLDDNDEDAPIFPPEPLSDIAIASSGLMDKIVTYLNKPKRKWTDINTWTGQTGVMYAITGKRMDIVQKFIECGINLNAGDEKHWTPLHYAVSTNNVECVCLFLNYGVDVRIKSNHQETPLTLAFGFKQQEIMKYLLNFYYEFANINLTNIKFDFKYGLGNNREDIILLTIALENGLMEPFEIIWERIDLEEIINLPTDRLIQKYLYQSLFAPSSNLHCIKIADIRYVLNNIAFFLQNAFLSKNFDHTRRMALLFMLLSTGVRVSLDNIRHIYQVCGFNKELEALIYAANHDWSGLQQINADNVLLHFILNFFEGISYYELLKFMRKFHQSDVVPWFKFFSLTSDLKKKLSNSLLRRSDELLNLLCDVPEFPSLLQLARLAVQKSIKQTHKITKPYQFHDAVKTLCIPESLKAIVLFKKPIYI